MGNRIEECTDATSTRAPDAVDKPVGLPSSAVMLPLALIPAYNPVSELPLILRNLLNSGTVDAVIVVDDGSGPQSEPVFEEIARTNKVHLIRKSANGGKGSALKTGLEFAHVNYPQCPGIVTADADGQHRPDDIARIALALKEHPEDLVLGIRRFDTKVPLRSRFGNELTRHIFNALTGQKLADTQTGLRGIPMGMVSDLVRLPGNGYEFELEMLFECRKLHHPIRQLVIRTIYTDENRSSHFRPLIDSLKIYSVFPRNLAASILSARKPS